ncbi:hypothetical protein [Caballeronia sp. BR00000012568055]|uniref:hypothetical protein n=1 Tax=Caballeronia sp. BR00000012568055 TaxID=2918761 RepID=UPI0023F6AA9A|nr:hypothetical protein [Caballeronia sp. BR00000012568055]
MLTKSSRRGETAGNDLADAEKKIARAARSAQRLAQLSESQRAGETLDLFAEDAERANLQAQNTDIRQGTFEGFELPDVFLAAVQARVAPSAPSTSSAPKRIVQADTAQPEPAQASFDEVAAPDEPKASAMLAPPSDANEEADRAPATLAATLIAQDRDGTTLLRHHQPEAAPDLDRVRATAFADTIDALRAVLVEQRAVTTAHARHLKTMLSFIVCAMLLAVAANIAQTAVLLRMRHDNALQQNRVGQLMLEQQATLASLFDTDSANVGIARASAAVPDASPIEPVSAAAPANRPHHTHHRARHAAH